MFKKKKSNTRYSREKTDRSVQMRVSSPRIMFFQSLKALKGGLKISIILAFLGCGVFYGYHYVRDHFLTSEEFALNHLELKTNGFLDEGEVAEIAGIDPSGTIFSFDPTEAEERLVARPEIVSANVDRHYPDTVKIILSERVPVAWLASADLGIAGRNPLSGLLIDADGVTFKCQGNLWKIARGLPVIDVGKAEDHEFQLGKKMMHKDAERALALLKLINESEVNDWSVKRIVVKNFYSLQLITSDNVVATFGMYEHERQLNDLIAALRHAEETQRELEWVNLLPKHNIPGKFKADAVLTDGVLTIQND